MDKDKKIAIESTSEDEDKLFKVLMKCCRNRNKPDLHSFTVLILGGVAFVDCGREDKQVLIRAYYDGKDNFTDWVGLPVAACNRLINIGADVETIEI